jgi:uncharacterized repeat protein (TIGR03803 family)
MIMSEALRLPAAIAAVCILTVSTLAQTQPTTASTYKEKVLYAFTGGSDGYQPDGMIIRDAKGNLYGTTTFGGNMSGKCGSGYLDDGCGVVFEVNTAGKFSVLHAFNFSDGANARIALQDSNGDLYGTTTWGGNSACQYGGCGVIFKLTTAGDLTVLYSFTGGSDGANPNSLIRGASGNFYGTTSGGSDNYGNVFELTSSGKFEVLYSFTQPNNGSIPNGVIRDSKGNLYGTTFEGGLYEYGTVFKLDPAGKETVLHSFDGKSDGDSPLSALVMDKAGNLYGTASLGGYEKGNCDLPDSPVGCGTVFKVDAAEAFSTIFKFDSADGNYPGPLIEDAHGNLYGATGFGGNGCSQGGCGVVYKLAAGGKETILFAFRGKSDGNRPQAVIADSKGNLYGTTLNGGDLSCKPEKGVGCGLIFQLTP